MFRYQMDVPPTAGTRRRTRKRVSVLVDTQLPSSVDATPRAGKRHGKRLRKTSSTYRKGYITSTMLDNAPADAMIDESKQLLVYRKEN